MALIDLAELKLRFRIAPSTTANDQLLSILLRDAVAAVETFLGRIIYDDPENPRTFGNVRADYPKLQGFRVTDTWQNNRYVSSGYDEFGRATNVPIPVVTTGLGPLSDYPDYPRIEAVCNQAIADTVADVYYRPNSMVLLERESGVMQSYGRLVHGLPARVRASLKPIKDLQTV